MIRMVSRLGRAALLPLVGDLPGALPKLLHRVRDGLGLGGERHNLRLGQPKAARAVWLQAAEQTLATLQQCGGSAAQGSAVSSGWRWCSTLMAR